MRILGVIGIFWASTAMAAERFDPETGLRINHYTEATPKSVPGAQTINVDQAHQLWQQEALFVDVLSITVGRYDELDGFWPEDTPVRESIPNSIWLPNVGFGRPDQDMQDYLMSNVSDRAQAGDPIVVFCIDSCWMGWNATQHLANAGYSNVHWFPQGTDHWGQAGYPLAVVEPIPVDVD